MKFTTQDHFRTAKKMPNKGTKQFRTERKKIANYLKLKRKVDGNSAARAAHRAGTVTTGLEAGRRIKHLS